MPSSPIDCQAQFYRKRPRFQPFLRCSPSPLTTPGIATFPNRCDCPPIPLLSIRAWRTRWQSAALPRDRYSVGLSLTNDHRHDLAALICGGDESVVRCLSVDENLLESRSVTPDGHIQRYPRYFRFFSSARKSPSAGRDGIGLHPRRIEGRPVPAKPSADRPWRPRFAVRSPAKG